MAERVPSPPGFDLAGAALDLEVRARRYTPIHTLPGVTELIRKLHRNPWAAPAALAALDAELAAHPDRTVSIEAPLFSAADGGGGKRDGRH